MWEQSVDSLVARIGASINEMRFWARSTRFLGSIDLSSGIKFVAYRIRQNIRNDFNKFRFASKQLETVEYGGKSELNSVLCG